MSQKIFIIVALTIIVANATEVRECKNQPFPENVRIKDCESPPCILKRGFNTELQIDFLVRKYFRKFSINYYINSDQYYICSEELW